MAVGLPASSASADVMNGWDTIVNFNSYLCLEVADWRKDNGAPVRQWGCTNGANQKWWATPVANESASWIFNRNADVSASYKCLEIADWSKANGAPARMFDCTGGANQKWVYMPYGSTYRWKNVHSGKCLEIADWGTGYGGQARQWECTNGANQSWL
ncbi:RICIN domain-containing protein [Streptomyces sp. NPDC006512]|uniref:RICIN domain-containing protein n=1 Tax=Streptomyces sp. NPDC006512 TaxID=3154307 RepID=UPI0033B04A1C